MKFNIYPGYTTIGIVVENDESKVNDQGYHDMDKRIQVRMAEFHGPSPNDYNPPDTQFASGFVEDKDLPWIKVPTTPGFSTKIKKQLYPKGYSVYVAFPTGDIKNALITRSDYVESNLTVGGGVVSVPGTGSTTAEKRDSAEKLWAVGKAIGLTDAQCAGMLGNVETETGYMDSTTVEGIYDEPHQVGTDKTRVMKDGIPSKTVNDYCTKELFPMYDRLGTDYYKPGYLISGTSDYGVGIGLIGFTGDAAKDVYDYCTKLGRSWSDFPGQAANYLGGGPIYSKRFPVFTNFCKNKGYENDVIKCAQAWFGIMEMPLSTGPGLRTYGNGYQQRLTHSQEWYSALHDQSAALCTKHKSFVDEVLSIIKSTTSS